MPIARDIYLRGKCSTEDAWRQVLARTQSRSSTRLTHPVDALRPVLLEYLTYGGSTSGVEQGFSKLLKNISPQQQSTNRSSECDIVRIVTSKAATTTTHCHPPPPTHHPRPTTHHPPPTS